MGVHEHLTLQQSNRKLNVLPNIDMNSSESLLKIQFISMYSSSNTSFLSSEKLRSS
jgi:hypothetical protein